MAPNLSVSQHAQIRDMLNDGRFTLRQISKANNCSIPAVKAIKRNLRAFGSTTAPSNHGGRPRSITRVMLNPLLEHLLRKPGLFLEEMVVLLWDEFGVRVTKSSVNRVLRSISWSKKNARRIARGQNPDLRDSYLHSISSLYSWQVVYVDESGCDQRIGFRRTGWSPLGVTPAQITQFHRGQQYQILPAYSQDGIILSRVFQGTTDSAMFEDFIEQLLHHCGRFPEPNSVLIMDNASFHRSQRIEEICDAAGVVLVYLAPYSPELNLIEEFFAELKAFIKRNWGLYEESPEQGFGSFLEWCVDVVGGKAKNARGHFRHAGWTIDEPETRYN